MSLVGVAAGIITRWRSVKIRGFDVKNSLRLSHACQFSCSRDIPAAIYTLDLLLAPICNLNVINYARLIGIIRE